MTERAPFMACQPGFISISLHRSLVAQFCEVPNDSNKKSPAAVKNAGLERGGRHGGMGAGGATAEPRFS